MLNAQKINEKLFLISVFASLIFLYSNFYFGVEQGVVQAGRNFRFIIKTFIFVNLFYYMCFNFVISTYRLLVVSLVSYLSIKNILSINYVDSEVMQIYNYLFFIPILFTKLSYKMLKKVYGMLCIVTIAMLIYDFFNPMKAFVNGGFVGGVGNPSSFGFLLIISSILIRDFTLVSTALRASTIFTGAGMAVLVSGLIQLRFTFKSLHYFFANLSIFVLVIVFFNSELGFLGRAAEHVMAKLTALSTGNFSDSFSLKNRIDYNIDGWNLYTNNIVHILIGSVGEPVIFTGDGYYIALLASYGTVGFILFSIVIMNTKFYISSTNYDVNSSRYIIIIFLYAFITNRMIDYWPMAFIFFLAIVHCNESEIYDKDTGLQR